MVRLFVFVDYRSVMLGTEVVAVDLPASFGTAMEAHDAIKEFLATEDEFVITDASADDWPFAVETVRAFWTIEVPCA